MQRQPERLVKISISLPADLAAYADEQARRAGTSHSQVISECLAAAQREAQEALAAEGCRFFAAKAAPFAEASAGPAAEAWDDER